MFRTLDSFWNSSLRDWPFSGWDRAGLGTTFRSPMALDVIRYEDRYELVFDLPGADPESIELTVDNRELLLTAERPTSVGEDGQFVSRQRPHGTVSHRLYLGDQLDADEMVADYDHGVLTVTVPVSESAKPRKVEIGVGAAAPAITAEATEKS